MKLSDPSLRSSGCWLAAAMLLATVAPARAQEFKPGCALPFAEIAEEHPIDKTCSAEGESASEAHRLSNLAKNNFCATGAAVRLTFLSFVRLQRAAEKTGVPFGSVAQMPGDRTALKGVHTTSTGKKIGEGDMVQYVAYILEAHASNTKKGEAVNCKKSGAESNDVHIVLGRTPDDDPCDTVTAQISPHFRPDAWAELVHHKLERHPVRFTGALFFDASHKPCTAEKRASPARVSIWEIHPVYAIDVCKKTSLAACHASKKSVWVPLDQWLGLKEEPDD